MRTLIRKSLIPLILDFRACYIYQLSQKELPLECLPLEGIKNNPLSKRSMYNFSRYYSSRSHTALKMPCFMKICGGQTGRWRLPWNPNRRPRTRCWLQPEWLSLVSCPSILPMSLIIRLREFWAIPISFLAPLLITIRRKRCSRGFEPRP